MRVDVPPALDADVDVANLVVSGVLATVLGLYAAWIAADLLARWLVVAVVTAVAGYGLYAKSDDREMAVYACYAAAGLVLVTPIFVVLPGALSADAYGVSAWALTFTIGNAILVAFFAIPAVALAYVGHRLDGGYGVVAWARTERHR